ncbi:unnamed protein product [Penicillium olsonii]|nr:unnamed protein product [Penicillium olsonii]
MRTGAAVRIPEIYAAFGVSDRLYLIMEFIQTDHIASDIQRARAISDIASIEVPLDISPGPVGGGCIHMTNFWDDGISDVHYPSIQDLAGHLNRVLEVFARHRKLDRIDFSHERMVCCYTDLKKAHFLVDADDQLWVSAFRQVNFLPETLMYFALSKQLVSRDSLPPEYYGMIPATPTQNLEALSAARQWFLGGSSIYCCFDAALPHCHDYSDIQPLLPRSGRHIS